MIFDPRQKKLIDFKMTIDVTIDKGDGPKKLHFEYTSVSDLLNTIKRTHPELAEYYDSLFENVEISKAAK